MSEKPKNEKAKELFNIVKSTKDVIKLSMLNDEIQKDDYWNMQDKMNLKWLIDARIREILKENEDAYIRNILGKS